MSGQQLSPIAIAIAHDDADRVESLVRVTPSLMQIETGSGSLLHYAAAEGAISCVKLLVSLGMDVNRPEDDENTEGPLWSAVSFGHETVAKWLLANGAQSNCVVTSTGEERNFCLTNAVVENRLDLVKLLVKYGANVNVHFANRVPLSLAESLGHTAIAEFLRKHGALTLEQIQAQQKKTKPKPKGKK